eukprot:582465-Rhodomonas_salina.2
MPRLPQHCQTAYGPPGISRCSVPGRCVRGTNKTSGCVQTVIENLKSGLYAGPEEMAEDVRRTFTNAMTYNPKKHAIHISARSSALHLSEPTAGAFMPSCCCL